MTIHPSQLLKFLGKSRAAELGSDKNEVRSLSFVVFALFFYQLMEPGIDIAFIHESLTRRVTIQSHMSAAMGVAFFATALMLLPHLANLTFFPKRLSQRLPRKLAAIAAMIGAVLWAVLGFLAWPLHYDWLSGVYLVRSAVDLYLGVLLGISLNAQQAREAYELAQRRQALIDQAKREVSE